MFINFFFFNNFIQEISFTGNYAAHCHCFSPFFGRKSSLNTDNHILYMATFLCFDTASLSWILFDNLCAFGSAPSRMHSGCEIWKNDHLLHVNLSLRTSISMKTRLFIIQYESQCHHVQVFHTSGADTVICVNIGCGMI